jgi:hypothetical protein
MYGLNLAADAHWRASTIAFIEDQILSGGGPKTIVSGLGRTVFGTLLSGANKCNGFTTIDPDWISAPSVFRPEDVGKSLSLVGPVRDWYGNELIDRNGNVVVVDQAAHPEKLEAAMHWAKWLSMVTGLDIRVMCIEAWILLYTDAFMRHDYSSLHKLQNVACAGEPFRPQCLGTFRYPYGKVIDGRVLPELISDLRNPAYGIKLIYVHGEGLLL